MIDKLVTAFVYVSFLASVAQAETSDHGNNLNTGFFLLHNVLDNEASLPLLLDLKTAPQEIQDYAKLISQTAKGEEAVMEKMRDADSKINWDQNPLPKFEQEVRASITGEKEHQLLFGTKGTDFVRALLVSQAEATKYMASIAKILSQQDPSPWHRREFSCMSAEWQALYQKDFQLLRNY